MGCWFKTNKEQVILSTFLTYRSDYQISLWNIWIANLIMIAIEVSEDEEVASIRHVRGGQSHHEWPWRGHTLRGVCRQLRQLHGSRLVSHAQHHQQLPGKTEASFYASGLCFFLGDKLFSSFPPPRKITKKNLLTNCSHGILRVINVLKICKFIKVTISCFCWPKMTWNRFCD